jgi:hypothetical protein
MTARVLQFPQAPLLRYTGSSPRRHPKTGSMPARSLHLIAAATRSLASSTQSQADRIVAQIEREIAAQAYNRVQQRYRQTAPAANVVEFETPSSVARRIFQAIRSFAYSA